MKMNNTKLWVLAAILCICGACITTCCISSDDNPVVETQQPTIQRIREEASCWQAPLATIDPFRTLRPMATTGASALRWQRR